MLHLRLAIALCPTLSACGGPEPARRRLSFDEAVGSGSALTEKTRYTVGGRHSLHYTLTVRDGATGAVIDGPRLVKADAKARGGAAAIAEEQMGRTQRVVILEALTQSIMRELTLPPALASAAPPLNPS